MSMDREHRLRLEVAAAALADALDECDHDQLMNEALPVIVQVLAERGVELPDFVRMALGV